MSGDMEDRALESLRGSPQSGHFTPNGAGAESPEVQASLHWAADQIEDEMRHWPDGPSKVAMAKVRDRILAPHRFIKHQLDAALKAAASQ